MGGEVFASLGSRGDVRRFGRNGLLKVDGLGSSHPTLARWSTDEALRKDGAPGKKNRCRRRVEAFGLASSSFFIPNQITDEI